MIRPQLDTSTTPVAADLQLPGSPEESLHEVKLADRAHFDRNDDDDDRDEE